MAVIIWYLILILIIPIVPLSGYNLNNRRTADMYEHKTYGIWNLMIQKKIDKDSRIYFGIDNLFNHRDDDRALSARVYRID